MTMLDTLFGLIPAASRGQQWLADELQLINWGGYDGAHRLRFAPSATLLCGGSGSGKSTLMDAYIALMMPHTTPFNGASNGGVTGRARGGEQRNIISYGRGKLDESRGETGTEVRVLRGGGSDTWTAIAMTWENHDGSYFTAVRAWYIPATARTLDEVVKVRGVVNDRFRLEDLEAAAGQRLVDSAVRAAGIETMPTDREFTARLFSVLGIGAAGAGAKALSLLARIQAGQQITTVDELYKRMVLEEPETMAAADAVVSHFDELESTRQRMLNAQRQVRMLTPIRGIQTKAAEAEQQLRLIDEVGSPSQPDSLASVWVSTRRLDLLHTAESELKVITHDLDAQRRDLEAACQAAEAQRDALQEVLRSSGGDRLETADRELKRIGGRLVEVRRARERFAARIASLGETPSTEAEFKSLAAQAQTALADPHATGTARDHYFAAKKAVEQVKQRYDEVLAEQRSAKERRGSIPEDLHHLRVALAQAAGMSPQEVPFVGELVEVATPFEPWREAFNLALGGFATTLLIDEGRLAQFRTAINSLRLPKRLRFEGATLGIPERRGLDDRRLPGRLDYTDSPFIGWLQERLEAQFDFVCVDGPEQLSQHRKALTITGQLSHGSRGAHGGHGTRNVLGFSNHRRLTELAAEAEALQHQLGVAHQRLRQAEKDLDSLEARRRAYERMVEWSWQDIDVDSVAKEQTHWQRIVDEVTEGNPKIAELKQQIARFKAEADKAHENIGRVKGKQERAAERWAEVTDAVDDSQRIVDAAEDAGIVLEAAQESYLMARFGQMMGREDLPAAKRLEHLEATLAGAEQRLVEDRESALTTLEEQHELLRRTLEQFLEAWPNPNLRADPESSIQDFERILADLETSGLHELEAEWKQSLLKLSGNDLTSLDSTLGRSLREIQERIEPINQIMSDLPFYDDDHRLQIATRENQSEVRRRFRKELREVRALVDQADSDESRQQAYDRMSRLIARIRRSAPDFAELIDVRNHVRVSAEKVKAETKEHVSLYDHIGEKSGGESQELIAFIVGAALRYQLGDADAERPRYAPVFLDEALIKADAHFTKRAIGAWRGLGFQLIIGAPNDKYSAIEPHVEVEYDILKDTHGRSWAKPKVGLAQ